MPTASTMTDPLPVHQAMEAVPSSPRTPSETSTTVSGMPKRRRRYPPQHTFHLNIGRVEVPRSLPPVRSIGTQTDESACRVESELNKKWNRRALKWFNKWIMPVLRAAIAILDWILSRIGFGVRLR